MVSINLLQICHLQKLGATMEIEKRLGHNYFQLVDMKKILLSQKPYTVKNMSFTTQ
jgi:hypothetical protein